MRRPRTRASGPGAVQSFRDRGAAARRAAMRTADDLRAKGIAALTDLPRRDQAAPRAPATMNPAAGSRLQAGASTITSRANTAASADTDDGERAARYSRLLKIAIAGDRRSSLRPEPGLPLEAAEGPAVNRLRANGPCPAHTQEGRWPMIWEYLAGELSVLLEKLQSATDAPAGDRENQPPNAGMV